jgi:hypothetical protein
MPNMERITWSGIALHGGPLPRYAASHGCPMSLRESSSSVRVNLSKDAQDQPL